ncbi:MAG: ion channel protein [Arthrobacter sp.]|uniref:ion channel protein n=1 Tax=Arthrobacter sp. TaxID=1667 RepID=UPI00347B858B
MSGHGAPSIGTLLRLSIPAILIGVVSALSLFAVEEAAHLLEHLLWEALPEAWGIAPASGWWIFGVLAVTGLLIGLILTYVPGHGGHDSATVQLIAPPIALGAVPGLVVVTVLALAGGVSLGPESPIIAINTAVLIALVARLWPGVGIELVMMLTIAGTIGALFGTPVAAILILTGVVAAAPSGGGLWDRLFLPLLAAGAGTVTMRLLVGPPFGLGDIPPLGTPQVSQILAGAVVASGAAAVVVAGAFFFRPLHAAFRRLGRPLVYTTLGGLILGGLGALGGPLTLFKGGPQAAELVQSAEDYTAAQLAVAIAIKLAALLIAATSGFRGGRVFPAAFLGVASGLLGHMLLPAVPLGLALACGVLGSVLAETHEGWIALFIAVAVVGDITVLPVLCLVLLPVWLLVSRAPVMHVHIAEHKPSGSAA